jgi:hypothetical protein
MEARQEEHTAGGFHLALTPYLARPWISCDRSRGVREVGRAAPPALAPAPCDASRRPYSPASALAAAGAWAAAAAAAARCCPDQAPPGGGALKVWRGGREGGRVCLAGSKASWRLCRHNSCGGMSSVPGQAGRTWCSWWAQMASRSAGSG